MSSRSRYRDDNECIQYKIGLQHFSSFMANIKQIAKLAKVSMGTVSNVLNGLPSVREPARQRVLRAVESLEYQPSLLGRALRKDKTNMIGMIVSDITNPFFPSVVRGAEDVAFKNDYRLVLCNSDNDFSKESAYLRDLRTYLPSGLIIMTVNLNEGTKQAEDYRKNGAGVVYVDRIPVGWTGDAVTSKNESGALEAAKHLIGLGHTAIAMLAGPLDRTNATERVSGYKLAMKRAKLSIPAGYIQDTGFDKVSGQTKTRLLLERKDRPTAIFAANDLLAFGAMLAIREMGLRCPEDVSVVGFDNLDMAEVTTPALTTVEQSGYQLGATAAQIVLDRVSGDKGPAKKIYLPTTLKLRDSVSAPGKKNKPVKR